MKQQPEHMLWCIFFWIALSVFYPSLSCAQNSDKKPQEALKPHLTEKLQQDSTWYFKEMAYQNDRWFAHDKALHFGGSFLSTIALKTFADNPAQFEKNASLYMASGITLTLGIGKELRDGQQPKNIFSTKDLVADVAGILAAVLVLQLF